MFQIFYFVHGFVTKCSCRLEIGASKTGAKWRNFKELHRRGPN